MKKSKTNLIKLLLLIILVTFFVKITPIANASIIDDIKLLFSDNTKKELTLNSKITHASSGDLNHDGKFDSGEILKFTYIIDNPTNKEISFATLKTNIPRNNLNFIHDIRGTSSLSDKNKTIIIPNLRINPGENLEISFNARINYSTNNDLGISTEPEIITLDKKSLLKSKKKEINAKKLKGKLPSNVNMKNE